MNGHVVWRAFAVVVLLGVLLVPAQSARAEWVYWSYADGTDVDIWGYWTYYTRKRYIDWSPYGIWFQKYDGPAMEIFWYDCGGGGNGPGPTKSISNSDPAPGVYLKNNGSTPTSLTFCLAVRNQNNNYDTFTGAMDWDGHS